MTFSRRLADLALIAGLVAYATILISLLWRHPYLLTALLLLPPLALGWRLGDPRRALTLAAVGLLLGPATEMCCVAAGLWRYVETGGLPLVPPWAFPLWACFGSALWLIGRAVLGAAPDDGTPAAVLTWTVGGIGVEIAIFVTLGHSTPLALLAAVPFAALLLVRRRRALTLLLLAAGALIGPLCEALPIASGAWSYRSPELFGMPAWLPLGYGIFATLVAYAGEAVCGLVLRRAIAIASAPSR
ncbi:MAG: hypothetical protein JXR83_22055 [Deltaproteobacteria bacterium]|nr:hypothetical protein [Deltaproteobacteria bacterium]